MKKTTSAKTALLASYGLIAFTGMAAAQSTVELYGQVDVGVTHANNGTSINPGRGPVGQWALQQGTASRLGFKGQEDLGGGLYARFNLEHRFFGDTGMQDSGAFFKGVSTVSLASAQWGEVYMGRDVVPAFYLTCTADPTCWSFTSQPGQPYAYANYNGSVAADNSGIRRNNSVGYRTPSFRGLSAEVAYAFGEDIRRSTKGFNVSYNQGPVYAAIGYDGAASDNRLWILAGGYDFGVVRPLFTYSDAKGGATTPGYDAKSASLTFVVPISRGKVFLGAGRLVAHTGSGGTDVKSNKFYVGMDHNLSKRTMLYANIGSAKSTDLTRSTAFDFGIRHKF